MHTLVMAVLRNPLMMAAWGLFVAVALAIGSLPLFVGFAVVLPVLAHSTWHLYRKLVEPDLSPRATAAKRKDGAMLQISQPFSCPGPTRMSHRKRNLSGLSVLGRKAGNKVGSTPTLD